MSLANAAAVASAARNLVLLGDPQQLNQPLKGSHPPGADHSALGHLLAGLATMPPHLGLFLERTWRLHPNICAYTSEVFYEGRLSPEPGRDRQQVAGTAPLDGSGIRFLPVRHAGNSNESQEEAAAIVQLMERLLAAGAHWVNDRGEASSLRLEDVLVIAPYNAQVRRIASSLRGIRVGTVDKFQGQQAPIAIYSMATSSPEQAPRGMEFLYNLNRLNVATSRARCISVVIASPELIRVRCHTARQMQLANALCRFIELATGP
jgi:superfamily I DNA and/or RNA helicase